MLTASASMPLQATPKPSFRKNSLSTTVKNLKSAVQKRVNRFYKSLIGSNDCSSTEVIRSRLILLIAAFVAVEYFSYVRLTRRMPREEPPTLRSPRSMPQQTERERQQQEREERIRRAREQLHIDQEESLRYRELREIRERIERQRKEREQIEQGRTRRQREEQLAQMERERQARLRNYKQDGDTDEDTEDADQTPTCHSCCKSPRTLQPFPCRNSHPAFICFSCLTKIKIKGRVVFDTLYLKKECPFCRQALNVPPGFLDPQHFKCSLDPDSFRRLQALRFFGSVGWVPDN